MCVGLNLRRLGDHNEELILGGFLKLLGGTEKKSFQIHNSGESIEPLINLYTIDTLKSRRFSVTD